MLLRKTGNYLEHIYDFDSNRFFLNSKMSGRKRKEMLVIVIAMQALIYL
jgi:hypothetical protein